MEDHGDRETIKAAALDPISVAARMDFAHYTAEIFKDVGTKLHVWGHMLGTDRRNGLSPFGHGDDVAVAVSMLLRIASQLVSGCFGTRKPTEVICSGSGDVVIQQIDQHDESSAD